MRQTDIIDAIRGIVAGASIDASPLNYDICHRYVTRSDPDVCHGFELALAEADPISARAFEAIRDNAGPARGQIDGARFIARLDVQLAALSGATSEALTESLDYNQVLDDGAASLRALDLGPEAASIITLLAAQTSKVADRSAALESRLASASEELAALRKELDAAKREGESDALTSLPNRRSFDTRIIEEITAAHGSRQPLSLAFCDVDHFKRFNDTWGHRLGDQVLRLVGSQLATQFKENGMPARFGGEEFVILLPNLGSAEAFDLLERFCGTIRARVLRTRSDGREIGTVTLSAGIATLRRGEDAAALIERADAAMYAAKKAGRDRVMFAP